MSTCEGVRPTVNSAPANRGPTKEPNLPAATAAPIPVPLTRAA